MGGGSSVLSMCNVVYMMPVREDYISAAKMEEFEGVPGGKQTIPGGLGTGIQKLRRLPGGGHTGVAETGEGYLKQLIWGKMGILCGRP